MYFQNKQAGFIQIPILAIAVFVFVSATGGYYALKQKETKTAPELTEQIETVATTTNTGDTATTTIVEDEVIEEEKQIVQEPPRRPVEQNQPKKSFTLDKILGEEPKKKSNEDYEEESQEFAREAKVLIELLEKDKANFQLVKDTLDDHKYRSIKNAEELMGSWIDVIDDQYSWASPDSLSVFGYAKTLIAEHTDFLTKLISDYYNLTSELFINKSYDKTYTQLITESQDMLRQCINLSSSEWLDNQKISRYEKESCSNANLVMWAGGVDLDSNEKQLTKILDDLTEMDILVSDLVDKTLNTVMYVVSDMIKDVKEIENREQIRLLELENALLQVEYSVVQSTPSFNQIRCFTTTNDSIFKENRAYNTRCEPYTQTVAEKCALQKARSVSTSGVYIGGLVSPECQ